MMHDRTPTFDERMREVFLRKPQLKFSAVFLSNHQDGFLRINEAPSQQLPQT
jgi:hypothetical protein